jgi:tetratricopeptide (TPR) repeat protein
MVSTIFEDDRISVHFVPTQGDCSGIAALSYSPMNHNFAAKGIPARAALLSMKFDVFGIIAKQNNWYPQASLKAAAAVLLPRLQSYRKRWAYGSSMGAYGAIKYSALMGCDYVLALAPQCSIDPTDVAPWDSRFTRHFSPALNAGMKIRSSDMAGRIVIIGDPMLAADLRHFELIEQCGEVTLIPAYFCDHYVVNPIASRQILAALFNAIQKGDLASAREIYRKARKGSNYYRGSLMQALARRRLQQGRLDAALAASTAATEALPDNADFLVTKSRIHTRRKERDAAIAAASRALELNPTREWYHQIMRDAESG